MRIAERMKAAINIGGLKLCLFVVIEKLFKHSCAKQYTYRILSEACPEDYPKLLCNVFLLWTGERLDLSNPKTFNEKIQWMKLYDSTPEKTRLADKYLVRNWVEEKIGEEHLIPLLGVWDKFDDIKFETLPEAFVLKCNHGSGTNLVVTNKNKLDIKKAKKQFDAWMDTNFAFVDGLELHYSDIPRKIIAEKYIEQMDSNLLDYKIHVFNGVPKIIQVIGDRDLKKHRAKECFLTPDWVPEELMYHTYTMYDTPPQKPDNIDEMMRIAKILGAGFRYVRVDLYNLEGQILFGEMTFTPASGMGKWGRKGSIFSRLMD